MRKLALAAAAAVALVAPGCVNYQGQYPSPNQLTEVVLKENDFKVVPFAATALNKKGEPVFSANEGEMLLDPDPLKVMAEQYRAGKTQVIGYFVGQVMRATGGKASPGLVNEILKRLLT